MLFWVASSAISSPVIRPSHMTTILSAIPMTSGISEDTNMTAIPCCFSWFIRLYISTLAATSIPLVGSSNITTLELRARLPAFTSTLGVLTFKSSTTFRHISSSLDRLTTPILLHSKSRFGRAILCRILSFVHSPSFFLSSGASTIPACMASSGL